MDRTSKILKVITAMQSHRLEEIIQEYNWYKSYRFPMQEDFIYPMDFLWLFTEEKGAKCILELVRKTEFNPNDAYFVKVGTELWSFSSKKDLLEIVDLRDIATFCADKNISFGFEDLEVIINDYEEEAE